MTSLDSNPKIEILPEHIIDQIKAGEVLERPASLIKELLENSLDAKSTEINIHLVENGMDLLSIEDNGIGMDFKNLPFAFLRHATSKLRNYEDLYRLRSFGFRGEALASVAASSRLTCTTQPRDLTSEGGKIVINGGETHLLVPQQASTQGTSLYIKDLFYNTPARLKFVKSKVSEKAALKKMLYSFVLSHPQVNFSIKWDDKEKEIYKAVHTDDHFTRVSQVFFGKKTNEVNRLFESSEEYDGYKVKVFFTPDTYTTPQYRHHYLFANKRFFQDKSIHSAVLRNLDSLWRFGESGHYIVDITTPAEELDVNVHPNKTQIKFMRMDVIYSLIVTSLKKAIKTQMPALPPEKVPGTFFSQDENQSFDLMHFASSGEDTSPAEYIARPFGDNTVQAITNSTYLKLSPQFIIDQSVRPIRLIDCKKMLSVYLAKSFLSVVNSSELPTPLLISEPFQIKDKSIDQHFESLRTLGLEFDRLNPEFIVLRTIPRFLPNAWVVDTVDALIKFLLAKKNLEPNTLQQFFETELADQILEEISPSFVEKMMSSQESSTFVCELKNSLLKSLFK
jgi:DNA mismatch repair protein MutL